jgi:O-antigen/teichoic acid export membrane protein
MSEPRQDADLVRTAGRGVIYITVAKIWFLLTGFILIFGLPRIFKWSAGGDEERGQALFGAYKLVFMGVSFINNGIITGTIQAVSKFTSEGSSDPGAVRRAALKVQGSLGVVLAVVYIGFAGFLADGLGSPDLAALMRLSAGVIAAYSCYAVFIGSFNGQRLFHRQALFDIVYSTLKIALIIGLAAAGFEVLGTVAGFLVASVVIALAAGFASGFGAKGTFPARRYLGFAAVLIAYTFVLNLVLSLDLFLLKGITSRLALAAGDGAEAASELSKALAGQYGAAQGLAFIPYQAVLAIAFVAFPMISRVTFQADAAVTRQYVRRTMRFATILCAGLATVFVALPGQALALAFPAEYAPAAPALRILSLGIVAYGLMVVSNTILNGAGLPWRAMAVVLATLAAVSAGVVGFLVCSGPEGDPLLAAAGGTAIGMGLGLVISAVVVRRRFGTFWPWLSAARVLAAAATATVAGHFLPHGGRLLTLGECLLVLATYLVVLFVTREFGAEDLDHLRRVLRRRRT